ncbi:MAG: ammonium transporter [Candidatus Nitrosocaldaceae archaeon]
MKMKTTWAILVTILSISYIAAYGEVQILPNEAQPNENGSIPLFVGPEENPYECRDEAGNPCPIDTGDNAWMLTSSALVLLMTPGVAFFYAGLARRKSVNSTIMMVFIVMGIITVQWTLYGYSLAFGPAINGQHDFVGDFSYAFLNGVSHKAPLEGPLFPMTIPHQTFMAFQLTFAIITPALIVGGLVDRIKFSAFAIFVVIWATVVYDPLAHWVWGGGFLFDLGALDFAGGTVVHISSGWSALAGALVLGRRLGLGKVPMEPHNIPMIILGASLLWFGWFGFNAGSAVAASGLAASAWVVTNLATGTAAVTWMLMSWAHTGKPSIVGAASGAVAGLVGITPASGFVAPMGAMIIGFVVAMVCYGAVIFKNRRGWDDALDVWGVHGTGGTVGAILTGILANAHINGFDGAWEGDIAQLGVNTLGAAVAIAYSFGLSLLIFKVMDLVWPGGIRVTPREEEVGLDIAQHGERAYVEE